MGENNNPTPMNSSSVSSEDRTLAMILYLLSLFSSFIGPLVIWLLKKDESEFIDYHGKECLNLSITIVILGIVSAFLTIILIGLITGAIVGVYAFVITIIAAIKAYNGEYYRIPYIFRFIK